MNGMHNLIELLEKTFKAKRDSPAIEDADGSLCFGELRHTALRIAAAIADKRKEQCEKNNLLSCTQGASAG